MLALSSKSRLLGTWKNSKTLTPDHEDEEDGSKDGRDKDNTDADDSDRNSINLDYYRTNMYLS